jgi:hypothetical protein
VPYTIGHAARRIGTIVSNGAGWGEDNWGTDPWGSGVYPVVLLPDPNRNSDHPQDPEASQLYEVDHKRAGQIVQTYTYDEVRTWSFEWDTLSSGDLTSMKTFFDDRTFIYYPDFEGSPGLSYTVRWLEKRWRPRPLRGNTIFVIRGTFEEIAA